MKLLLGNFATRIGSSKIITARNCDNALWHTTLLFCCYMPIFNIHDYSHIHVIEDNKTYQVKGPDWLKSSQTEVYLWYVPSTCDYCHKISRFAQPSHSYSCLKAGHPSLNKLQSHSYIIVWFFMWLHCVLLKDAIKLFFSDVNNG